MTAIAHEVTLPSGGIATGITMLYGSTIGWLVTVLTGLQPPVDGSDPPATDVGDPQLESDTPGEAPVNEPALPPPSASVDKPKPTFRRSGMTINLGIAMNSCRQYFCDDTSKYHGGKLGIGPTLNMDFGLRPHPFFDVTGGFTVSYLPVKDADSGDFSHGWYGLQAIGRFYPLRHTRWDPYVGAGMGFFQFWSWSGIDDEDNIYNFSRANLILTTGLDVYVTPSFSIGPRFAYNITFGGRYCYWYEDEDKVCRAAKTFADSQHASAHDGKEHVMPRPWELGLMVKWRR